MRVEDLPSPECSAVYYDVTDGEANRDRPDQLSIKESLDGIAAATNQDRSGVIDDALNTYVEVFESQVAHIREGIRQADAGEFATKAKVKRALSRLTSSAR